MDVNLNGLFFVAQQAARRMLASDRGVILNMGSTNGIMGYPSMPTTTPRRQVLSS